MIPDAFAASRSTPLPWKTALDRAFGRHAMTTGTPMRSSPVRLAMRVTPNFGSNGWRRAIVSAGDVLRCVPRR
jgi:hypothetical protein